MDMINETVDSAPGTAATIDLGGKVSAKYVKASDALPDNYITNWMALDGDDWEIFRAKLEHGTPDQLTGRTAIKTNVSGSYTGIGSASRIDLSAAATVQIAATVDNVKLSPLGVAEDILVSAHLNNWAGGTVSSGTTANAQYAWPFVVEETWNLTKLGIYLETGSDTASAEIGLTQMIDGIPGEDYLASASIPVVSAGNSTIVYGNVTDMEVPPGHYFIHFTCDEALNLLMAYADARANMLPAMKHINSTARSVSTLQYWKTTVGATLDAAPESIVTPSTTQRLGVAVMSRVA